MIQFDLDRREPVRRLTISGDLVLAHGDELKRRLLELIRSGGQLEICLNGIGQIDVSALQLLCAAHRQAVVQHKRLSLQAEGADSLMALSEALGMTGREGCRFDIDSGCLLDRLPEAAPPVE